MTEPAMAIARFHSFVAKGVVLRGMVRGRPRAMVSYGEIVTVERTPSGFGFRFHGTVREKLVVYMRRSARREFEQQLRSGGVVIVDEFGARIDESQFAKEADPRYNKNVSTGFPPFLVSVFAPGFVFRWWSGRAMRQWSDDGEGE